jgi:hypothetical protein
MREPGSDAPRLPARNVRQPAVGQTWHYAKRDIFTREVVDDQVDHVASVDHTVQIDSRFEASAKAEKPKWGAKLLRKYTGHHETPAGPLPSEIQDPWGMVQVDPHWSQVQVFETPIPLWPTQLEPGWQTHIVTNYKTPNDEDSRYWDQVMKAQAWETVTVPAGKFKALRFTNYIKFKDGDFSRDNSVRRETLWFAPEVGRWVIRESQGSYYVADSTIMQPYNESGYRWELLEWS